jgi:diaminohydroxyphosphoribosylaminopyrimidine deaminase/5-amino-6-(5-phosphoribosylamino)uracil reductase
MKNIDQYYMQQALSLASRARLTVSPNPMVGCLIVKNGAIISEGWHKFAGGNHAEINALNSIGDDANGATVYVTLEPCCHTGKTGPCTESLIKSQVKKVIVATLDPNPKVSGKGVNNLKQGGIEVVVGVLEQQAQDLNKIFMHFQKHKKPYIIAKWAMSLDGQTSVNANDSKQISSIESKTYTHQLRNMCDAIIVGKDTLIVDNPELDVRIGVEHILQPIRFIVFSKLADVDMSWKVLDQSKSKTIFVCTSISDIAKQDLDSAGVDVWLIKSYRNRVHLDTLVGKMGEIGITSLLVEGGKTLLSSFFDSKLVNEIVSYISPNIIANNSPKLSVNYDRVAGIGQDILVNAKPEVCKYV